MQSAPWLSRARVHRKRASWLGADHASGSPNTPGALTLAMAEAIKPVLKGLVHHFAGLPVARRKMRHARCRLEDRQLRATLVASEVRAETAERKLAQARAIVSASEALIAHLRLEIAGLRREGYGHSWDCRARLIDQMELQFEELEAAAIEDEIAAEKAPKTPRSSGFSKSSRPDQGF